MLWDVCLAMSCFRIRYTGRGHIAALSKQLCVVVLQDINPIFIRINCFTYLTLLRSALMFRVQALERVLALVDKHGLGSLSADDVALLLRNRKQGAPFAASFRKHKVRSLDSFQMSDVGRYFRQSLGANASVQ